MNRSSFRENHMTFSAGIVEDDCLKLSSDNGPQSSVFMKLKSQGPGRGRNLPGIAKGPLERVKSSHLSITGSDFGSLPGSPVGSCHSMNSLRGSSSRRPSLRSHVSDARRRLVSASCESTRSNLDPVTPKDSQGATSSEDSNEDGVFVAPPWTESTDEIAVEKIFTSPTVSKIHFLKCISGQRSLLGGDYVYGGATPTETKALQEKEEDDAIDHSLKKTFHRELKGDEQYLDDFLARHFDQPLEVDMINVDTISDCTDDDDI